MRRGLWFAAGAGTAVWGMVRGRRVAEALTADGLRDRAAAVGLGVRMFRDEVAQGRAERETELRERLGLAPHGRPELTAPTARPPDRRSDPDVLTAPTGLAEPAAHRPERGSS